MERRETDPTHEVSRATGVEKETLKPGRKPTGRTKAKSRYRLVRRNGSVDPDGG
jgi:hypothetical protein